MFFLYSLQRGGYPFERDDLTVEEWLAVGEMRLAIETPRVPDGK